MRRIKISVSSLPTRCEICHQSDCFDRQTGSCSRCADISIPMILSSSSRRRAHRACWITGYAVIALIGISSFLLSHGNIWKPHGAGASSHNKPWTNPYITEAISASHNERREFLKAVERGDIKMVDKFLLDGAPVNFTNDQGDTPLMVAAREGQVAIVKNLLAAGANIDTENSSNLNALQLAADSSNQQAAEIIKMLLAAGADANAGYLCCTYPLAYAASNNNTAAVKALLSGGARVNSCQESGIIHQTLESAETEPYEMVKLLLAAGADANADGYYGDNTLTLAASKGYPRVVKILLAAGARANVGGYQNTPLSAAAASGNPAIVKMLLAAGASAKQRTFYESTVLISAAGSCSLDTIKLLLAAGADVNFADENGFTPLIVAANQQDCRSVEIIKTLLAAGAKVNARTSTNDRALMRAAYWEHPEIVKLLIDAGANVNIQDDEGHTPLKWASLWQSKETMELLIAAGARR